MNEMGLLAKFFAVAKKAASLPEESEIEKEIDQLERERRAAQILNDAQAEPIDCRATMRRAWTKQLFMHSN